MNSIEFKGVSSTTIDGLIICELPPISKPPMRTKQTYVDGRHGAKIEELGYSPYDKAVTIGLHGNFDIDKVIKYFSGEGDIVFSNEPDKVYHGCIVNQIDYNRLLRFRTAVVTFRVQPFKHKYHEAYVEAKTATASGTNLVLKDCGATPMEISTEASEVFVHGKNLADVNSFNINTNTSCDVTEEGYVIVAKGGTKNPYGFSTIALPLHMKGKQYTLKCDDITSEQDVGARAQIAVYSPSGTQFFSCFQSKKTVDFVIPEDVTAMYLGVYTNNTNTVLTTDNVVVFKGLRLVPTEYKSDVWCKFQSAQAIPVVDGVAKTTGIEPATIISNADNISMKASYFKPYEVFNEGLEESKPMVVIKGSGTIEMKVNGSVVFTYTFPDGEGEVVIDSEAEDAFLGAELRNRNMFGEFPVLAPKTNKIEWSGDVTSIEILPRSRWL
jgi:predicted phage tail component-like protein